MAQPPRDEFGEPEAEFELESAGDDDTWRTGSSTRARAGEAAFEDEDVDDDAPPAGRARAARPGRTRRTVGLAVAGLLALGVVSGVLVHGQERDRRTPEAAVRDYVELIESGDVEAAGALVPVPGDDAAAVAPQSPPPGPTTDRSSTLDLGKRLRDAGLLTNELYGGIAGIEDVVVEPPGTGATPAVGETADVTVTYTVRDFPASTVLRVERLPDAFPALPAWRVLDSLTVPTVVRQDDPGIGTVKIAGVPTVASGEPAVGYQEYATMLYPGVYPVTFEGNEYLSASEIELRVAATREPVPAAGVTPTTAFLNVAPTGEAYDLTLLSAQDFLEACEARPPAVDVATCPQAYRDSFASGEEAIYVAGFTRTSMSVAGVPRGDGSLQPVLNGFVEGTVVISTPDGGRNLAFNLQVRLFLEDDGGVRTEVQAGANG